jgi:hypothetical protein
MKHGPLALVDGDMPILVIATRDSMYGKMQVRLAPRQLDTRPANLTWRQLEAPTDASPERPPALAGRDEAWERG